MISLRGMHEWWHFNETGDLGPLFKVLEDGALAPAVQQMIANDQKLKHPGAFYLTAVKHRGNYARTSRLFKAGQQISEWTREYNKQDAAIAQALEAGLISNTTQGKDAVGIYHAEIERCARENREGDE